MKKLLIAVAVVALAIACKKEKEAKDDALVQPLFSTTPMHTFGGYHLL